MNRIHINGSQFIVIQKVCYHVSYHCVSEGMHTIFTRREKQTQTQPGITVGCKAIPSEGINTRSHIGFCSVSELNKRRAQSWLTYFWDKNVSSLLLINLQERFVEETSIGWWFMYCNVDLSWRGCILYYTIKNYRVERKRREKSGVSG